MTQSLPATQDALSAPSIRLDIIQRYLNGTSIQVLAAEYQTSRMTIYRWMMNGQSDKQYEALITDGLIKRIADADEDLENASTPYDIARARERARFARMDFERRRPLLYGPKQHIQEDRTVTITIHKLTPQPVVVEPSIVEATQLTPQNVGESSE